MPTVPNLVHRPLVGARKMNSQLRMINHFKYTVQLKRSVQFYSSWHEDEE